MSRPKLEVADVFRRHGVAWRAANKAHLSLAQRRVMTAIEVCRTAALGGHVERCEDCAHTRIAYNSCRNRHCPKCQWPVAAAWLAAREAELLPVPYFHIVFTRPAIAGQIPMPRRLDHLPTVLAREEVEHLLKAVADLKLRTALITIYSAGLRISEAIRLTARDIDSARMVICVRQGKGGQDRYTILSKQLLGILRDYWHRTRPPHWLFPGRNPSRPVTKRALQLACRRAAAAAGLSKSVTVHTLRHSFATHLLEQGVDIRVIQDLLGHRHIKSTVGYARVAIDMIRQVQSPLELLNMAATAPD